MLGAQITPGTVQAQAPEAIQPRVAWVVGGEPRGAGQGADSSDGASQSAPGGWALDIEVPDGWALYAPDTGSLGLPLAAEWIDPRGVGVPAPLIAPSSRRERSEVGEVSVYRGRVGVLVPEPPRGWHPAFLRLRWALCRRDLCVPGVTELPWVPRVHPPAIAPTTLKTS